MPSAALSAIHAIILCAWAARSFSSNTLGRRTWQPSVVKDDSGSGSDSSSSGAGSWRSKAKEFEDNPEGFDGDDSNKKLNIAFVTGNAMKQREINLILSNNAATSNDGESFIDLRILDVDLPEIQEINTEAVAKNKAIQGTQLAGGACVVEDTSLEFDALGGMPGPFIKWFQDKLGCDVSFTFRTISQANILRPSSCFHLFKKCRGCTRF